MTKLNPAQQALLDAVAEERSRSRAAVEQARLEFEARKWELEAPLRVAVKDAVDAGVPKRQIGQVIPTSDHKTVDNMAKGAGKEFSDRP